MLDERGPGWQGERARITLEVLERNLPAERAVLEYFVCGPDAMIHAVERSLHALGVPMSQCHSELVDLVQRAVRRLLACWLAVVTAVLLLGLAPAFACLQRPAPSAPAALGATGSSSRAPTESPPPASRAATSEASQPLPSAQGAERGRQVYDEQNCRRCHSIAGSGNVRQPLDGVGSRLDREQIRTWIVAPQQMSRGVVKTPYDLPPEELEALVDYLAGLRDAGPKQGR